MVRIAFENEAMQKTIGVSKVTGATKLAMRHSLGLIAAIDVR